MTPLGSLADTGNLRPQSDTVGTPGSETACIELGTSCTGSHHLPYLKKRQYVYLSYDVASGSEITPCNKIDKPLVV